MPLPLWIDLKWNVGIRIHGHDIELKNERFVTACKQSPYVPGYQLRLVMPRVRFFFDGGHIGVSTIGFGPGWERIARQAGAGKIPCPVYPINVEQDVDQQLKKVAPIGQMIKRAEKLHADPDVRKELEEQTRLFVEKSNFFADYGICPPVRHVREVTPRMRRPYWPNLFSGSLAESGVFVWEFDIQMTQAYIAAHKTIPAVELEDVNRLSRGTWNDDGTNPHIKDYQYMDCHPTNIINGYYIDWEIYGWDPGIVQ